MSAARRLLPLANRVLVRKLELETVSAGGVFLPETAAKASNEAEVVAVGPGIHGDDGKLIPMGVSVGDKVLLPSFGRGEEVTLGEDTFQLLSDNDILAKFEN